MHVVFLTADQIAEAYAANRREWPNRASFSGQQTAQASNITSGFASAPLAEPPSQSERTDPFAVYDEFEGLTADEIYEAERREDMRSDCLNYAVMTMPDVTDQAAILARAQAFFDWIEG